MIITDPILRRTLLRRPRFEPVSLMVDAALELKARNNFLRPEVMAAVFKSQGAMRTAIRERRGDRWKREKLGAELNPSVANMSVRELLELFQAGLHTALQSILFPDYLSLEVVLREDQDFDYACRFVEKGEVQFKPFQLKRLPPTIVGDAYFDSFIRGLKKYNSSKDLSVVVLVDQDISIYPPSLPIGGLKFGALWFYGLDGEGLGIFGCPLEDLRQGVWWHGEVVNGSGRLQLHRKSGDYVETIDSGALRSKRFARHRRD